MIVRCDGGCGAEHTPECDETDSWLLIVPMCGEPPSLHACSYACAHLALTLAEAIQAAGNG